MGHFRSPFFEKLSHFFRFFFDFLAHFFSIFFGYFGLIFFDFLAHFCWSIWVAHFLPFCRKPFGKLFGKPLLVIVFYGVPLFVVFLALSLFFCCPFCWFLCCFSSCCVFCVVFWNLRFFRVRRVVFYHCVIFRGLLWFLGSSGLWGFLRFAEGASRPLLGGLWATGFYGV